MQVSWKVCSPTSPPQPLNTTTLYNKIMFLYNQNIGYQRFHWKNSVRRKQK